MCRRDLLPHTRGARFAARPQRARGVVLATPCGPCRCCPRHAPLPARTGRQRRCAEETGGRGLWGAGRTNLQYVQRPFAQTTQRARREENVRRWRRHGVHLGQPQREEQGCVAAEESRGGTDPAEQHGHAAAARRRVHLKGALARWCRRVGRRRRARRCCWRRHRGARARVLPRDCVHTPARVPASAPPRNTALEALPTLRQLRQLRALRGCARQTRSRCRARARTFTSPPSPPPSPRPRCAPAERLTRQRTMRA